MRCAETKKMTWGEGGYDGTPNQWEGDVLW